MPRTPIDLVLDDLWCVAQGRTASLAPKDLAREAVFALLDLLEAVQSPHAADFRRAYGHLDAT